jgi:hypothetical protein
LETSIRHTKIDYDKKEFKLEEIFRQLKLTYNDYNENIFVDFVFDNLRIKCKLGMDSLVVDVAIEK